LLNVSGDAKEKLRVECSRPDCVFFHPDDRKKPDMCLCSHPDKHAPVHRYQRPCPLYRLDWKKRAGAAGLDSW
jgi:hypothetical protein